MTSELAAGIREGLAQLTAVDRSRRRFGAAAHGYELRPPVADPPIELPADVRAIAAEIGGGGAGPGYGWLPIDRVQPYALPGGARALPLAHLGCGQIAALHLATGAVWLDARGPRVCREVAPTFVDWYVGDWLARVVAGAWPATYLDGAACALPAALTGYLAACEQELGLAAGALAGAELRAALARLGPGAIAIAADGPPELFDAGDLADPCLACARMIANLTVDGLDPAAVAPGVRPRPQR